MRRGNLSTCGRVCRRAVRWMSTAGLLLSAAGCLEPQQPSTLDQQIAQQVTPVRQAADEARAAVEQTRQQLTEQIAGLLTEVSAERQRIDELRRQMESTQAALARFEALDMPAALQALQTARADLDRLTGDVQSRMDATDQALDAAAKDRRMLAGADAELRAYVDSSFKTLDSQSAQARDSLRATLTDRIEQEKNATQLAIRTVENTVQAGSAQIALAIQLLRESLDAEQQSLAGRRQRVREILAGLDRQFTAEGVQNPNELASLYFREAIALHEEYLEQPENTRRLDDALLNYRKGLALRPDDAEMHFQLARLLMEVDRPSEAEPHLRYYLSHGNQVKNLDQARQWLGDQ